MHQGDLRILYWTKFLLSLKTNFYVFGRQIILSDEKFCPVWKAVLIYQLSYLEYLIKQKLRGKILLILIDNFFWKKNFYISVIFPQAEMVLKRDKLRLLIYFYQVTLPYGATLLGIIL